MRRASALLVLAAWLGVGAPARPAEGTPLLLPLAREGSLLAPDRELHFAGSLAVAATLRIEGRPAAAAVGVTVGAGALKEVYDAFWKPKRLGRGASRLDFLADLAGAAVGIWIVRAVDR
jgi:uncharacterized protein YfiM (DUF2279 family)